MQRINTSGYLVTAFAPPPPILWIEHLNNIVIIISITVTVVLIFSDLSEVIYERIIDWRSYNINPANSLSLCFHIVSAEVMKPSHTALGEDT